MKKAWKIWLNISKKLSGILANILLTIIYIIIFLPLSFIIQQFFKKSLLGHTQIARENSLWIKRKKINQNLEWAYEQ